MCVYIYILKLLKNDFQSDIIIMKLWNGLIIFVFKFKKINELNEIAAWNFSNLKYVLNLLMTIKIKFNLIFIRNYKSSLISKIKFSFSLLADDTSDTPIKILVEVAR